MHVNSYCVDFLIFLHKQYKDEIPKPPLTPYMMFMQTKQPKVKQKYPDLPMTEVATKIGEWEHDMRREV